MDWFLVRCGEIRLEVISIKESSEAKRPWLFVSSGHVSCKRFVCNHQDIKSLALCEIKINVTSFVILCFLHENLSVYYYIYLS